MISRSTNRRAQGTEAENTAAEYLSQKGYIVLQRNLYTPYGEIDILAKQGDEYVCVEVRSRAGRVREDFLPENCITRTKYSHLVRSLLTLAFLHNKPVRIDLITMEGAHIRQHYQDITV